MKVALGFHHHLPARWKHSLQRNNEGHGQVRLHIVMGKLLPVTDKAWGA